MKRKTMEKRGYVNFPVDTMRSSGEGGMVVKLVVVDSKKDEESWPLCCGGQVYDIYSEVLVGDDQAPYPKLREHYTSQEDIMAEQLEIRDWQRRHFPHLDSGDPKSPCLDDYVSASYLAAIVLGTTGWSGYDAENEHSWLAKYDDLTEKGKALYDSIQALYPFATIHLLTFLDT